MKYGLQVIPAWSKQEGKVNNVSRFLLDLALEAEKAGWDGYFLWDHLWFSWQPIPLSDPWSVLSAISACTDKILLGTHVTPLPRRRPQIVAKQLVTIDQISSGRVILGIGSGAKAARNEDFLSFGEKASYPLLLEKCKEGVDVITGLWTGESFSYDGNHYEVKNVTFQPTPVQKPRIPIWVGGNGLKSIKLASQYEGWVTGGDNPSAGVKGYSMEWVAKKREKIREYQKTGTSYDIAYEYEFPETKKEMKTQQEKAESAGITWLLDGIFGLRFNGLKALEHVKKGPPI